MVLTAILLVLFTLSIRWVAPLPVTIVLFGATVAGATSALMFPRRKTEKV